MTTRRFLILRLEGPLLAFGGVTIDQVGVTRDFPAVSMLTGLFANALGYRRKDVEAHQRLQDRLVFAARRERENPLGLLTDTQNAQLEKNDRGWTTHGHPEGRDGASYGAPHRLLRDYHADACVTVALTLDPADEAPKVEALAEALDRPARPLFIGRKSCLPSGRIFQTLLMADTAHAALSHVPAVETGNGVMAAQWPPGEGPQSGPDVDRITRLADLRNWNTGLHGGSRAIVEGRIAVAAEAGQ
ncbi:MULTISPECIES: type I-E CRISPR-associated protein Cas5/CasD [unclassified Aurantimonas]|uniref:type I-E CRISPR-associated protein Cas5/CasD n=1 Tax=unclassified Aurantimonas TaxID=2638230 RepID=UPI002E192C5C|nr:MULTISPECIES: type I-E CRISPR-associated protein Cas5/CasD [unclassified Aurantimonas]MEC5293083.1 type I-E CRISPR-associated protein Cas5/CasD [Aurantimonas sp. C2-3-R2]MEC5414123.1 type I-E CRISPR-associated protein Cas5/CasD [Aurantimonas sp. C2-4-R8]